VLLIISVKGVALQSSISRLPSRINRLKSPPTLTGNYVYQRLLEERKKERNEEINKIRKTKEITKARKEGRKNEQKKK